jgi:beta-aspartyl-peptidase (threonine type)
MKPFIVPLLALFLPTAASPPLAAAPDYVLVIHGGAGAPEKLSPALRKQYEDKLKEALEAGRGFLARGGTSVDAVEAAIKVLEDSPLFNAGRGAVFTHEGRNELDAAIMNGKDRKAGAVAGVTRIKNPITAARAVMEKSRHVLLIGEGAERFAFSKGVTEVSPVYFWTPEKWQELMEELEKAKKGKPRGQRPRPARHFGTVGAVALDKHGDLAAGTSTGGLTNKRYGRVGDSPIIGAGTYADNATCAVSATGTGELFIRNCVAYDIAARLKYGESKSVEKAARKVIGDQKTRGILPIGSGGVIVLDRKGRFTMPFNTDGMFRGYVTGEGKPHVAIYLGEK